MLACISSRKSSEFIAIQLTKWLDFLIYAQVDTLTQERERLQAEVTELSKLRDELLLNARIAEYIALKEEVEAVQTEALALRSEVEQMKLDAEDEMRIADEMKRYISLYMCGNCIAMFHLGMLVYRLLWTCRMSVCPAI